MKSIINVWFCLAALDNKTSSACYVDSLLPFTVLVSSKTSVIFFFIMSLINDRYSMIMIRLTRIRMFMNIFIFNIISLDRFCRSSLGKPKYLQFVSFLFIKAQHSRGLSLVQLNVLFYEIIEVELFQANQFYFFRLYVEEKDIICLKIIDYRLSSVLLEWFSPVDVEVRNVSG